MDKVQKAVKEYEEKNMADNDFHVPDEHPGNKNRECIIYVNL